MREQEVVVDLAGAGFVPPGRVGQLHVVDLVEVFLDGGGEVAFHDLHVIDVVLEREVGHARVVHHVECLRRGVEIEARDVARVDGFDEHRDAEFRGGRGGEAQAGEIGLAHRRLTHAARLEAGHHVQALRAQHLGVVEGDADAVLEPGAFRRIAREPAVACRPVARRHVEQHHLEPVAVELFANRLGRMLVREQELDAGEAGLCRGAETLEKRHLVEHHRQVGVELWHGGLRTRGLATRAAYTPRRAASAIPVRAARAAWPMRALRAIPAASSPVPGPVIARPSNTAVSAVAALVLPISLSPPM